MSGSGGGPDWVTPTNNSCAKLSQQTTLNSPNQAVLKQLKKGDILEIRLRPAGTTAVVEAMRGNDVAGTITSSVIQRLAECIQQGFVYVAEVMEDIKGGACKVHVRAK